MKKYINIGIALSLFFGLFFSVEQVSAQISLCQQVRNLVGSRENLVKVDTSLPGWNFADAILYHPTNNDYMKSYLDEYYTEEDRGKFTFLIQSKKSPTKDILCIVRPENLPNGYVYEGLWVS